MKQPELWDVIILGGGLAGLTLARQLKRARLETSIIVAEKQSHPVPEAAHKVGESTGEVGASYFRDVLGLGEHLAREQLSKAGLRFFLPCGDNSRIERRLEVGLSEFPPVSSYQLDRGRFENQLVRECRRDGIEVLDSCKVKVVSLGGDAHSVDLVGGQGLRSVAGRWVVDATGRACILKRHLGLQRPASHDVNAVWFRLAAPIELDAWSDHPAWRARTPYGFRRLSTTHFMGRGYWVWFIPLASDSTSVGIVADAALHPFSGLTKFERTMSWLQEHEPQCARVVYERRHLLQDFHALRHFAHGCARVFSPDRWALTGEAGVFLDPLYSPGSDFIGISNTFITDLITRNLDGEDIGVRAELYNQYYLSLFTYFLRTFEGKYARMGNPQVYAANLVWDLSLYWGVVALLFFHGKICDLDFYFSVRGIIDRARELNNRMQRLFQEWDKVEQADLSDAFINYLEVGWLRDWQAGLASKLNEEALRTRLARNLEALEVMAAEMFVRAAEPLSLFTEASLVNPYAISLRPQDWQAERLFERQEELAVAPAPDPDLGRIWFDDP